MNRARWRNRISPPSILLGTALLLSAVSTAILGAGTNRTLADSRCPATPSEAARAALRAGTGASARIDQIISRRGELVGRMLNVQRASGTNVAVVLPAESFVGRRMGDLVVYTRSSAGAGSEVHVVDIESGCDTRVASPTDVVRSAVIDPSGSAAYVHSVTRIGRRDAGVVRHDLATGTSSLAVPPLPPSEEFGPTFATELTWSVGGDALAVQSCGFERCRTRILDVAAGDVSTFDAPGQGALIGLTAAHLVTYADCHGLPCAVISIERQSGRASVLVDDAYGASLAAGSNGAALLTIETATGIVEVER